MPEQISEAVGAGISSAAVAVESVATAAGTAAAEGAVQSVGAVAETAAGVIPAAAEAVPGAVDAGVELAAQEGLASGAETVLETSGPDAALKGIVSGEEDLTQPAEVSSNLTESGMDQRAIDAANQRIAELKAQGKDPDFFERKAIYDEEVGKLSAPSETGDQAPVAQAEAGQQAEAAEGATTPPPQEDINPSAQAEQTAVTTNSGITDEIKNDPLFQKKLEEERVAAQARGEEIDEQKLSQEALAKYSQDKQAEQPQLTPEQQKIQQLEEKINGLVAENEELKNNIAQINEALGEMKDILMLLTQTMAEKEQDPKKKESLLALLIKIAAIIVVGSVIEGGKTVAPPLPSPGR